MMKDVPLSDSLQHHSVTLFSQSVTEMWTQSEQVTSWLQPVVSTSGQERLTLTFRASVLIFFVFGEVNSPAAAESHDTDVNQLVLIGEPFLC